MFQLNHRTYALLKNSAIKQAIFLENLVYNMLHLVLAPKTRPKLHIEISSKITSMSPSYASKSKIKLNNLLSFKTSVFFVYSLASICL